MKSGIVGNVRLVEQELLAIHPKHWQMFQHDRVILLDSRNHMINGFVGQRQRIAIG